MAYDQSYDQGLATAAKAYYDKSVDAPVEETAFGAVNVALDRSNLLSVRVQQLADKLVGTAPQPVGTSEGRSGPSAVFPALRAAARQTQSMVEDALNALDRIDSSLP